MANRHQQPHNGEVPPYMRLHYLRQTLGPNSTQAGQVPKMQQNPINSPATSPRDDHQPRHFGEDHSYEGHITDLDQGTEETDDHWETNEMVDDGYDQMLDSIPNDPDLENAILSLLLEYVPVPSRRRLGFLESSYVY